MNRFDCCPKCRSFDIELVEQKCGHKWEFHDSNDFTEEDYTEDCEFGGSKYRCLFCGHAFDKPGRRQVPIRAQLKKQLEKEA